MTTTRVSEFELAYEIKYLSEFGYGYEFGLGYGSDYGYVHGRWSVARSGSGSFNSEKDLIDDNDARVLT